MKRIISFVILFALISSLLMLSSCAKRTGPLRIGVLLPLTGPEAFDVDEVLDWAVDNNINTNKGINNRQIELVYKNLYQQDVVELAQEFIEDESIKIVIDTDKSHIYCRGYFPGIWWKEFYLENMPVGCGSDKGDPSHTFLKKCREDILNI
jgi:hypothetical protein